ncbi:MAG: hypothetical protein KDK54_20065 [Leptospiraceae bacterium]|nr:hypothetical protein [Leptospiraceae bacterium]
MKRIIVFLLLFPIGLISKTREVIYLDSIVRGSDIPEEFVNKIRRRLPMIVTNQYSDVYAYIDDDDLKKMLKLLQQKQRIGCKDEEACKKLIDDYYNSDYRITAILSKENEKYILDFKMIQTKGEVGSFMYSGTFSSEQADYLIDELSKEMLSKGKYKVNYNNAPLDVSSDIEISITGFQINTETAEPLKDISDKIVESYAKEKNELYKIKIREADEDLKNKNYSDAIQTYKKIIRDWEEINEPKSKKSLEDLIPDLHKRIQIGYSYSYQDEIKKVDSEVDKLNKSTLSSESYSPLMEKYKKLYIEYKNLNDIYKNTSISNALTDRYGKILSAYYSKKEKEIDLIYEKKEFYEAMKQFSWLHKDLMETSAFFPSHKVRAAGILEKRNKVELTGRNHLKNYVRIHLQIADLNNSKYNFDKDEPDKSNLLDEYLEDISENMEMARDQIIQNPLSEKEPKMIEEYNSYVDKINKNKEDRLAYPVDARSITNKEEVKREKDKQKRYEKELFDAQFSHWTSTVWRSAFFPGWGQLYNDQTRGGFYITATVLAGFNALLCCLRFDESNSSSNSIVPMAQYSEYLSYSIINNPNLLSDPVFVYTYYYLNNQPDPLVEKQRTANRIFAGIWILNLLDAILLTPFQMPKMNIPMAGRSIPLDSDTSFNLSVQQASRSGLHIPRTNNSLEINILFDHNFD